MLRREDELRLSKEVQDRYAEDPECWEWKWHVTEDVQLQVCHESGFFRAIEEGLDLLRSARVLFPEDDEIKNAAHYLRYNIHRPCPFSAGDVVPNLTLHDTEGAAKPLYDVLAPSSLTVVWAGSHT